MNPFTFVTQPTDLDGALAASRGARASSPAAPTCST
jgi:hypothetical protein